MSKEYGLEYVGCEIDIKRKVNVDMNQISLACLMMSLHMNKGELDEEMVRHMILNSIRGYRTMFKEDYGEIVLTYDSRAYWRKQVFPQYKRIVKKVEKKMVKIGIVFLEFSIRLKKKLENFCHIKL